MSGYGITDGASLTADNSYGGVQTFTRASNLGGASVPSGSFTGNVVWGVRSGAAALAGQVGEVIESVVSTAVNAAATGTYGEVTNITLTPGDWLITGHLQVINNAATHTVGGNLRMAVATATAAATGAVLGKSLISIAHLTTSDFLAMTTPQIRVNISASTTYYLNGMQTYSAGTPRWVGSLIATRMR